MLHLVYSYVAQRNQWLIEAQPTNQQEDDEIETQLAAINQMVIDNMKIDDENKPLLQTGPSLD